MGGGTWTGNDREHNDACRGRWLPVRNTATDRTGRGIGNDWYDAQCGGCRFWVALSGELGRDWGVCTRPGSVFDGRVRFEHDGCELFASGRTGPSAEFVELG